MSRKQQFFFASMMIFLATVTCQISDNPVSTPITESTQLVTDLPLYTPSRPTVNAGNDLHAIFPSFSLTDPNTVCIHNLDGLYGDALSCLDETGWHNYKDEYNETSNPTSTIPSELASCPDGRIYLVDDAIYQVEEGMLVDIGEAYGTIACGKGNELWVSDMSGISHFDGSIWTRHSLDKILGGGAEGSEYIYSMSIAPNGNAWVTTSRIIATFDGTEWKTLAPPGNPTYADRNGLAIDSSGVVWAIIFPEMCCINNQLLKYDGVQWTTFPVPEDEYHAVNFIASDHENRIWAALGRSKIYTFDPKTNEWDFQFDMQQVGLGKGGEYAISAMEFDGQGRLWVATDYGLGIYDGSTWTTYHIHTANLYIPADPSHMNDITGLFILGDGPPLPALEVKVPGSVQGRLVSRKSNPFTDAQVEICLRPTDLQSTGDLSGDSPCAHQAYHALADVDPDGSFMIPNVPIGSYYLMIKLFNVWAPMVHSGYIDVFMLEDAVNFIVNLGTETQLGDISTP